MHRPRMAPHTRMTPANENDSRGCCSRTVKTSGCCSRTTKTLDENNTRPTKEKTFATLPRKNRAHSSNNSPPQPRETCEARNSISLSNEVSAQMISPSIEPSAVWWSQKRNSSERAMSFSRVSPCLFPSSPGILRAFFSCWHLAMLEALKKMVSWIISALGDQ